MVKFFGRVDMNKQGNIASDMPAWSMTTHIDELQESIDSRERSLESGAVPFDNIQYQREELKKEKEKLNAILESRPKLSETDENKLRKIEKEVVPEIRNWLFTRSEMHMGLASPHEEVRRMTEPIIGIGKEAAEICEHNGIRVSRKGNSAFVSRNGAEKMWKLIKKYFNEPANVEALRRDKATVRTGFSKG